jgi:hypothetical protein
MGSENSPSHLSSIEDGTFFADLLDGLSTNRELKWKPLIAAIENAQNIDLLENVSKLCM